MNKSDKAMVRTYLKIDNISSPISYHNRFKETNALGFRRKQAASELAKRFALERAKIRAGSSRPGTSQAHQSVVNRTCESIDALSVLAKQREQIHQYDSHLVASKDDELPRADKDIDQATIFLLQSSFKKWDQELSSMCSYGSDYDPSKSPGFFTELTTSKTKSKVLCERLLKAKVEADIENRLQLAVTDPHHSWPLMALLSSTPSNSSYEKNISCYPPAVLLEDRPILQDIGNLNEPHRQNPCAERNLQNLRRRNVSVEKRTESARGKKKERNTTSMSACIPHDITGVVAESTAIVKITSCPYDEFRESMTQMIELHSDIVDVEELLYCYLALNSPEHYDVIVEAFKAAWHEFV